MWVKGMWKIESPKTGTGSHDTGAQSPSGHVQCPIQVAMQDHINTTLHYERLLRESSHDSAGVVVGLHHLEQQRRRQARFEKLMLNSRRCTPHESRQHFHQFRDLPPELRQQIWALAIARRVFVPRLAVGEVSQRLRPGAIARVCYESRYMALQCGEYWNLEVLSRGRDAVDRSFPFWLTPAADVLLLRPWEQPPSCPIARRRLQIVWDVSTFMAHPSPNADPRYLSGMPCDNWFSDNECIDVMAYPPTVVDRRRHSHVVPDLFRGNSMLVVDRHDDEQVARVFEILKREGERPWPPPRVLTQGEGTQPDDNDDDDDDDDREVVDLRDAAVTLSGEVGVEEWKLVERKIYQTALHERWAFSSETDPKTPRREDLVDETFWPRMENKWVAETVRAVKIRQVHVFILRED